MKILVVGAGVTGAAIAADKGHFVRTIDKKGQVLSFGSITRLLKKQG